MYKSSHFEVHDSNLKTTFMLERQGFKDPARGGNGIAGAAQPSQILERDPGDRDSARICLIMSDPIELQATTRMLEATGRQVLALGHVVGSSIEVRRFKPDVIIVDANMRSVSGPRLMDLLRKNFSHMAALIIYSDIEEDDLESLASLAGADDYLIKEATREAMMLKIERSLAVRT